MVAVGGGEYVVHRLPAAYRYGNAALVPQIRRLASEYPLVIQHYPFFGGAEFAVSGRRSERRSKLLLFYHMDVVGRGLVGFIARWHRRLFQPRLLDMADRIAVTSFDYLRHSDIAPVFSRYHERFRELAPSVDTARFSPGAKPERVLGRFGLNAGDRIVLFVGGLDQAHYFKGIPVFLRALATKGLSDVKAIIVGEGGLRPEYERQALSLNLGRRVFFAGGVSDGDLPDYYRTADVFVFPSIDKSEAFGVAALEALASGVPVVASDLPGVRTIVRHGETGYCCRPGSVSSFAARLEDLTHDDIARQRFGTAARRMVEEEYSDAVRMKRLRQIVGALLD